jgi:hypothetical protein
MNSRQLFRAHTFTLLIHRPICGSYPNQGILRLRYYLVIGSSALFCMPYLLACLIMVYMIYLIASLVLLL